MNWHRITHLEIPILHLPVVISLPDRPLQDRYQVAWRESCEDAPSYWRWRSTHSTWMSSEPTRYAHLDA